MLLKPGSRFPVFSPYKGEEAKERAQKRMELNAQKRQQLEQERKLLLKSMEIVTAAANLDLTKRKRDDHSDNDVSSDD